ASACNRDRGNRNNLTGVGRYHRGLVQIVKLFARGRANAFDSEIGFGHVRSPKEILKAELHLASWRAAVNRLARSERRMTYDIHHARAFFAKQMPFYMALKPFARLKPAND